MNAIFRTFLFLFPACLLAGLTGCFTEVGNPEDEVRMTASFQIDYTPDSLNLNPAATPDSVVVQQFDLILKDAGYHFTDSTAGYLWQNLEGSLVNFAGAAGQDTLAAQMLKSKSLANFQIDFNFPKGSPVRADTLDFAAFQQAGYVKGLYRLNDSSVEFLFALPDSAAGLTLKYTQDALKGWQDSSGYRCRLTFRAVQWLSSASLAQAVLEKDKSGRNIAIFDPTHNPGLHGILSGQFYQDFNSQQAYRDTGSTP